MKKHILFLGLVIIPCIAKAESAHTTHQYMMAAYHEFGGNMQTANELYTSALKEGTTHVFKGYIPFLYSAGQYGAILALIPKLDDTFKDDQSIQFIFAQTLEKTGNHAKADERFITLNGKFKHDQEIAFNAANSYIRRKEPKNALRVIDDLLNGAPAKPNNFIFLFLQAQIHMQLGNKDDALESVEKSLEVHPGFDKGWLMYALLQEQKGKLAESIKGFSAFLEITGGNREIEQHLIQLIFKQRMAKMQSNSLTINRDCFEQSLKLFQTNQYKQALESIEQCLNTQPDDTKGRLLKIQILSSMKNFEGVTKQLVSWINEKPEDDTWYKTLRLLTFENLPVHHAITALERVEKKHPNSLLPVLYLADLHARNNDMKATITYHKKASEKTDDANLKTKTLYHLATRYYETEQFDAMRETLEKAIALKQDYPPVYNLLAYYYATDGKDYQNAQKFLASALKKDKTNPHFLDTQALIYYKQGNYDKAFNLLQKLTKASPDDCTMLTNLAKTIFKKGDISTAITTAKKALPLARNNREKNRCATLLETWQVKKV